MSGLWHEQIRWAEVVGVESQDGRCGAAYPHSLGSACPSHRYSPLFVGCSEKVLSTSDLTCKSKIDKYCKIKIETVCTLLLFKWNEWTVLFCARMCKSLKNIAMCKIIKKGIYIIFCSGLRFVHTRVTCTRACGQQIWNQCRVKRLFLIQFRIFRKNTSLICCLFVEPSGETSLYCQATTIVLLINRECGVAHLQPMEQLKTHSLSHHTETQAYKGGFVGEHEVNTVTLSGLSIFCFVYFFPYLICVCSILSIPIHHSSCRYYNLHTHSSL